MSLYKRIHKEFQTMRFQLLFDHELFVKLTVMIYRKETVCLDTFQQDFKIRVDIEFLIWYFPYNDSDKLVFHSLLKIVYDFGGRKRFSY